MKKVLSGFIATCLCLVGVLAVRAQEKPPMGPPKVLTIYREVIKPGKGQAHEKVESNWAKLFAKANLGTHYIGATAMSGEPRAVFFAGFDSFEAWEKAEQAFEKLDPAIKAEDAKFAEEDGALLEGTRGVVAVYRPELSYRPGVEIGKMRYFAIEADHVRPGHGHDYEEAIKTVIAAHEKANINEHWAAFEVVAGAPDGTIIYFSPMKSLAEWDILEATHDKAFREAMGEEGLKKLREVFGAGLESEETNLLAFSPKMSYVSKETAAQDPGFWSPKPEAKPAAAKKEGAKPAAKKK